MNKILMVVLIVCGVVIVLIGMYLLTLYIRNRAMRAKYASFINNVHSYGSYDKLFGRVNGKLIVKNPMLFTHASERPRLPPRITPVSTVKDFLSHLGIDETIVINLDKSPDKMDKTMANFARVGITNYSRLRAFDGKTEIGLMKSALPEFSWHESDLDTYREFIEYIGYDPVKLGHQGCSASHIYVWMYIVQNKIPMCAIFEDDVCFHKDFVSMFVQAWKNRPDGVLYNVGCSNADGWSCKGIHVPTWVPNAYKTASFYILTLEGAQELLDRFSSKYFPIVPCADDIPFCGLDRSFKLYYDSNGAYDDYPSECGNRSCGIVTTPNAESRTSSIRETNMST
jgi:hypothetical protein